MFPLLLEGAEGALNEFAAPLVVSPLEVRSQRHQRRNVMAVLFKRLFQVLDVCLAVTVMIPRGDGHVARSERSFVPFVRFLGPFQGKVVAIGSPIVGRRDRLAHSGTQCWSRV